MTEAEWLASTDPVGMLWYLTHERNDGTNVAMWYERPRRLPLVSDRKVRLFACACARQVRGELRDARSRQAVEAAERFADGLTTQDELYEASEAACDAQQEQWEQTEMGREKRVVSQQWSATLWAYACSFSAVSSVASYLTGVNSPYLVPSLPLERQAAMLRSIVGNPWFVVERVHRPKNAAVVKSYSRSRTVRPGDHLLTIDEEWLTPTVLAVAQGCYEERWDWCPCFYAGRSDDQCQRCHGQAGKGFLNPTTLAILGDALEEAGCPTTVSCDCLADWCDGRKLHPLLVHLRSPGPHCRGMWSLDLVLGKE